MLFDTDVLISLLRGNAKAAGAVDNAESKAISIVTYMELLQGVRDKREMKAIRSFLADLRFVTLPLTENIGHRASIYMEEYSLSVAISMADALTAATAVESHEVLLTGNRKHCRPISELRARHFRP